MTDNDTTPAPTGPSRLPTSTVLLGAGGLLLILGAFLPWVTVGDLLGISGVSARYGIATLIVGLVALLAAFGAGRVFDMTKRRPVLIASGVLGALATILALYVGFAIRDNVAEDKTGEETAAQNDSSTNEDDSFAELGAEFAESLAAAFEIKTGVGVYATLIGGALVLAGGVTALKDE